MYIDDLISLTSHSNPHIQCSHRQLLSKFVVGLMIYYCHNPEFTVLELDALNKIERSLL